MTIIFIILLKVIFTCTIVLGMFYHVVGGFMMTAMSVDSSQRNERVAILLFFTLFIFFLVVELGLAFLICWIWHLG